MDKSLLIGGKTKLMGGEMYPRGISLWLAEMQAVQMIIWVLFKIHMWKGGQTERITYT